MRLFANFTALGLTFLCMCATPHTVAAADICDNVPAPVISLEFGSRYTAGSQSRSDIDDASNEEVNEALKPIDKFIQDLSRAANTVQTDPGKRKIMAGCVADAILAWASADALSDMASMNSKLAIPSRVGGIAMAYGQVRSSLSGQNAEQKTIEDWLKRRAFETRNYFDKEAPPKASRNNLRAWASFAVSEVGILTNDRELIDWAVQSNKTMIDQSAEDGSLPLEMGRKQYALHYQLHAAAPLFTSMARLCNAGYGTASVDLIQVQKIAHFSVAALQKPEMAESIAKAPQKIERDPKKLSGMLAWLEPYAAFTGDDALLASAPVTRPLLNSKLGGDLTRLYSDQKRGCKG